MRNKNMKNKKGFTLVELVIVIAVIAILAGVMIGTFSSVVNNAKRSSDYQEVKTRVDEMYMEFIADGVVPQSMIITKGYYIEFSKDEAKVISDFVSTQASDYKDTSNTKKLYATASTTDDGMVSSVNTTSTEDKYDIVMDVSAEIVEESETTAIRQKLDRVEVVTDSVKVNVTRAILTGRNGYKFLVVLEDGSYTVTDLKTK